MATRLYTRYQDLSKIDNSSNQFTEAPIMDDWSLKNDWNKVGSLAFTSSSDLAEGSHVKLVSDEIKNFGGQIVKKSRNVNEFTKYECLDYKRFLLKKVSSNHTNKKSSQIVKELFNKHFGNNTPLKLKIGSTKNVFPKLTFKDMSILDIISNLINLEFKKGTLILFDVDENGNMTYKSYPQKMEGYSISTAIDFTDTTDYSDIQTGYVLENSNNKSLINYSNTNLTGIWGDIGLVSTLNEEKSTISSSSLSSKNVKLTDADVKKAVSSINKQFKGTKHSYNGGSLDCISLSEKIFIKLKAEKIPNRFVKYPSSAANSGYHRVILVKYKSGFKLFDYSGMDKLFSGSLSKALKGSIVKEYKG